MMAKRTVIVAIVTTSFAACAQLTATPPSSWVDELSSTARNVTTSDILNRINSKTDLTKGVHVVVYRDRAVERLALFGSSSPGTDESAFTIWRFDYDKLKGVDLSIGEAVSVPVGTIVRVRNGNQVTNAIMRGIDPLTFSGPGYDLKITFVSYSLNHLQLFAVTSQKLTVDYGMQLLALVNERFGENVTLTVRNDSWFIGYRNHPALNWFIDDAPPPTSEVYAKSNALWCGVSRKTGKSCRLDGPSGTLQ